MKLLNFSFDKNEYVIYVNSNTSNVFEGSIVISDLHIDCAYYDWSVTFNPEFNVWIVPLNDKLRSITQSSEDFSGFLVKVYDNNKRLLQTEKIIINNKKPKINSPSYFPEHDITGHSYIDFFYGDLCKDIDFSDTVIDAGANVGFFTFLCKDKGATRVYSIEPDPFPFYYLNKNFKTESNIILINKAMSDKNENLTFALNLGGSVGSAAEKYTKSDNNFIITKETITLQDILKIEEKINLVKLDIEGSEFEVIKSLNADDFKKINQFFIEFHFNPKEIEDKLKENQYNIEYRHSSKNDEVGFIYAKKYENN